MNKFDKEKIPKLIAVYDISFKGMSKGVNMMFLVEKDVKTKGLSLKMRMRNDKSGEKEWHEPKRYVVTMEDCKTEIQTFIDDIKSKMPLSAKTQVEKVFEIQFKNEVMADIMKEMKESGHFNVKVIDEKDSQEKQDSTLSDFLENGRKGNILESDNQKEWNNIESEENEKELIKKHGKKKIEEIKKNIAKAGLDKNMPLVTKEEKEKEKTTTITMKKRKENKCGHTNEEHQRKENLSDKELGDIVSTIKSLTQFDDTTGVMWVMNITNDTEVPDRHKKEVSDKIKERGADSAMVAQGALILRNMNPMKVLSMFVTTLNITTDEAIKLLEAGQILGNDEGIERVESKL